MVDAASEVVGAYRLGPKLGEGATGTVYRATRVDDDLVVALKILKRALAGDPVYLARFRREARVAADVQHPHLVPVIEFGEADGGVYLVSEFWDGGSLAELIARDGRLPLADSIRVAGELAAALDALRRHQIVHRDVKPSNVLLGRNGAAGLTDFGMARSHAYTVLTKPGQVVGTLDYLAPELIEGKQATAEADVYALGCLVYECITGVTPFANRTLLEVAVAHLEEEPPDPRERRDTLSEQFCWALVRALQKDPRQRPPTATAYAHMLAATAAAPTGSG